MADWKVEEDTVANNIPDIQHYYGSRHGGGGHSCQGCPGKEDQSSSSSTIKLSSTTDCPVKKVKDSNSSGDSAISSKEDKMKSSEGKDTDSKAGSSVSSSSSAWWAPLAGWWRS